MLEWKRKQLEEEEKKQMARQAVHNTLPQSIKHIQLDLRDLMIQVSSQVSTVSLRTMCFRYNSTKTLEEVTPRSDENSFAFFSR